MKFLKRNQIIISVIALMLITAGYFNYIDNIETLEASSNSIYDLDEFAAIGEAKLVDAEVENENVLVHEHVNEKNTNTDNADKEGELSGISNKFETDSSSIMQEENEISTNSSVNQANPENADDYFAASKLERNDMYSEMIEVYERMIENSNVSETQKGIATNEIYNINTTKNAIMICENLIKNKGFEDVVVFSNNNSINVIVKATDLQTEHIAQIQNIISRELNASAENIHISCK